MSLASACTAPAAPAEDLSTAVEVSIAAARHNVAARTSDVPVTVRNASVDAITGPLRLVLTGGVPADIAYAYASGRTEDGLDYREVPLPDGLLSAGASATVVVPFVDRGRPFVRPDFRVDGTRLTPTTSRRLTVVVVPAAYDGSPDGSGFSIDVDGYRRGITDARSRLSLTVPANTTSVGAWLAPTWGGFTSLPEPHDTNPTTVFVELDEGKELYPDAELRIDEVGERILRRDTPRITLRLIERGKPLRLKADNLRVDLVDVRGDFHETTSLFQLAVDGTLSASAGRFHEIVDAMRPPLALTVSGESVDERPDGFFMVDTSFVVAHAKVAVQLRPPPSDPMLPIGGVLVIASLMGTDVRVAAITDATGRATLADLPRGNLDFQAERIVSGLVHRGQAAIAIDRDALVELTMLAPVDLANGVPPFRVVSRAGAVPVDPLPHRAPLRR